MHLNISINYYVFHVFLKKTTDVISQRSQRMLYTDICALLQTTSVDNSIGDVLFIHASSVVAVSEPLKNEDNLSCT
jgi:hypothetical protein